MPRRKSIPKRKVAPSLWHDPEENDRFQYPYRNPSNYLPSFSDPYSWDSKILLASLCHFYNQFHDGLLVVDNEALTNITPFISRLCMDTSLPSDFETKIEQFPPDDIPSRSIHDWQLIESDPDSILSVLEEITLHDQIIFYRMHNNCQFAINLVMVPWYSIEIYITDNTIAMDRIEKDASAIAEFLGLLLPEATIQY